MRRLIQRAAPWLAVGVIALSAWLLWPGGTTTPPRLLDPATLASALPPAAEAGFETPDAAAVWTPELPRDLGPHPAFRTELWDLTGQLRDSAGRRYGLRLTLVRLGLRGPEAADARSSALAAQGLLLGRLSLVPEDGAPLHAERSSRTAAGLAGATAEPPVVWLEDWRLAVSGAEAGAGQLSVRLDDSRLDLRLVPQKAPITPAATLLDSGAGARPSGSADNAAALRWLAAPRLELAGQLLLAGAETRVTGSAWLDHLWGDAVGSAAGLAGSRGQLALNRFLLQLDDGSELLCIQLRRRAGGGTPVPTCLVIASDGGTRVLRRRALTLAPGEAAWRSPDGAATYPVHWQLAAPELDLQLDIHALHPDQELMLGERLWSGVVAIKGMRQGRPIAGGGRMDLSGYAAADS
jgi:predicted secreted hydrolase